MHARAGRGAMSGVFGERRARRAGRKSAKAAHRTGLRAGPHGAPAARLAAGASHALRSRLAGAQKAPQQAPRSPPPGRRASRTSVDDAQPVQVLNPRRHLGQQRHDDALRSTMTRARHMPSSSEPPRRAARCSPPSSRCSSWCSQPLRGRAGAHQLDGGRLRVEHLVIQHVPQRAVAQLLRRSTRFLRAGAEVC